MTIDYLTKTYQTSPAVRKGLLKIAEQVADSIGTEFFRSLVKNIGEAVQADHVYLGEFAGGQVERLKILATFPGEGSGRTVRTDYELAGSVAAQAALAVSCAYTKDILKKFPSDDLLKETETQACIAVPLLNANKLAIGVLMAMYRRPLKSVATSKAILEMFAPRASAELQRKQGEAALRESEQRYHAFVSLNPDAMWRIEFEAPVATDLPEDEQLECIYRFGYLAECNDSLARLLGYDRATQMIGMSFRELARQAAPNLEDDLRSAIHSGFRFSTVERKPRLRDGSLRHLLRSQWGIVENGFLQRIWGTLRDITELRQAEEALRISEQRLGQLLESIQLLTVVLDHEGAITFCNDYLLRLTGWQAEEISGKKWFDLMVPPEEREKLEATFEAAHAVSPNPHRFESTLVGKDGRRWLIGWEGTSVRDSEGRVTGFAGVGRDITLHQAREAELLQARKLESIGRSVGVIAHDFGSLLTVISGYSAILLHGRGEQDSDYDALTQISRAAEQGAALTQQLMTFSRQQTLSPQLLDVNQVTEEFGTTLGPLLGEHVQLTIDLHPAPGLVCADANEIREVLLHLVANAREAMPDGGALTIATSSVELDQNRDPHFAGIPAGRYVMLSVTDNGVGMNEQTQAQLFEPFCGTKKDRKGSGLGLSTVFSIVHRRDGHILVETAPGAGTTIQVFLPRMEPQS